MHSACTGGTPAVIFTHTGACFFMTQELCAVTTQSKLQLFFLQSVENQALKILEKMLTVGKRSEFSS